MGRLTTSASRPATVYRVAPRPYIESPRDRISSRPATVYRVAPRPYIESPHDRSTGRHVAGFAVIFPKSAKMTCGGAAVLRGYSTVALTVILGFFRRIAAFL